MKRTSSDERAISVPPRKRRRRIVEAVVLAMGLLMLLDSLIGERGVLAMKRARVIHARQQEALDAERRETERLQEEVRRLTDDPKAIEDAARRDLGMMKPGEKVFMLRDLKADPNGH